MKKRLAALAATVFLIGTVLASADSGCDVALQNSTGTIPDRVNAVFERSLAAMESSTANGVHASTWLPPSSTDVILIKCLGRSAVSAIADHSGSDQSFERLLEIRMLAAVGGREVVAPLHRLMKASTSRTIRMAVLEALSSAPTEDAVPLIYSESRKSDDLQVRKKAEEVLARFDPHQVREILGNVGR